MSTAFYSVVRGVNFADNPHATGVTPRRVSRKQSEPAWHLKLERERAEQQPEQKRVRSKYWGKSSFQQKQGGTFVCQIPGCGKAYTTKFGLAHHQILQHREGTFREKGFDCPRCPRTFDRESALTGHLRKEHTISWHSRLLVHSAKASGRDRLAFECTLPQTADSLIISSLGSARFARKNTATVTRSSRCNFSCLNALFSLLVLRIYTLLILDDAAAGCCWLCCCGCCCWLLSLLAAGCWLLLLLAVAAPAAAVVAAAGCCCFCCAVAGAAATTTTTRPPPSSAPNHQHRPTTSTTTTTTNNDKKNSANNTTTTTTTT